MEVGSKPHTTLNRYRVEVFQKLGPTSTSQRRSGLASFKSIMKIGLTNWRIDCLTLFGEGMGWIIVVNKSVSEAN